MLRNRNTRPGLPHPTHPPGISHFPTNFISPLSKTVSEASPEVFQPLQGYGDVLGWKLDFSFSVSQCSQWSITRFGQRGSFCLNTETAKYCIMCQGLMASNTLTKGLHSFELLPPPTKPFFPSTGS